MDFFARQEHARRRTGWLVALFFAALAGLIATAYLVAVQVVGATSVSEPGYAPAPPPSMWNPDLFLLIAGGISTIVFGGTAFKLSQLRHGGGKVAESLGGRRIDPASTQYHERRLLNIVEEMALASGVPVPPVYLLTGQTGINAFAAGYSIHDAVIGVTEGAMRGLKREELQGVIAHEFSHILNGDMRLNIRLIGIVHGLLLLAIVGRVLIRLAASSRSGSGKRGGGVALFIALGLALIIIGYAGYFFGGLIKRAVSRQREYLADASAVQFTRNPLGLASALKKVGGLAQGGAVANDHAEELSHMFFADGIKRLMGGGSLFATHPPLAQRVKLLDPDFNGEFTVISQESLYASGNDDAKPREEKKKTAAGGVMGPDFIKRTIMVGGGLGGMAAHPTAMIQQIGILEADQLEASRGLLDALPGSLREAVHEPLGAQCVVIALLIAASSGGDSADAWTWVPASFTDAVGRHLDAVTHLEPRYRLILVDLALPALRALPAEQAERFVDLIDKIIRADQKIQLFEFAVMEMVRSGLRETLKLSVPRMTLNGVEMVAAEATALIGLMARLGATDDTAAEAAFRKSMDILGASFKDQALPQAGAMDLEGVKAALDRLLQTTMPVRKQLLEAAMVCLMSDQVVAENEVELFRALAATLEIPVPLSFGQA
ncbi:MAG TPA: M48 family metallopeptidase [Kiritimatiellia bacterium]|nr:M48 family metallopeptidase [Kiritimatiellia bacterium]HMO98038.1 M48 family metallopeptidase [Kiritimatiellia bacterium]HMP96563.1 M48 family metallopeptidase [Kiritimatiellia bacterium]